MDEDADTIEQDMWAYFFESGQGVAEGVANGIPWSGNERNHLFFGGVKDAYFEDYSGISGIDDPGDGRGFSLPVIADVSGSESVPRLAPNSDIVLEEEDDKEATEATGIRR